MSLEAREKTQVGSVVEVNFNGDRYTGVVISTYFNCSDKQKSLCVLPYGDGPYGEQRAFTTMLSSTSPVDSSSRQMVNFCPVCGEFLADTYDEENGTAECPSHGTVSVECSLEGK